MSYPLPAPGSTTVTGGWQGQQPPVATARSPGNCPVPAILCFFTLLLCEELICPRQDPDLSCAERGLQH